MQARVVDSLNLNQVRYDMNKQISSLLENPWLDPETCKEFMKKQRFMQRRPFFLMRLCDEIRHEIVIRKEMYGT